MPEKDAEAGPAATGTRPPRPTTSTTDLILTHNKLLRQDVVDAILADRAVAANLPPPPKRQKNGARGGRFVAWLLLGLILASGLYFRWANLNSVQNFGHDNGRDYFELLRWAREGQWPLLGPARITNDYTIGPGWFYTIAPAVFASRFSLAAGAATVGLIGILGALLAFVWVRRTTGSLTAALAVAALFCWASGWVEFQRQCWNPHPLFFGLMACAVLIHEARRHPLASLALYLMLLMLLPQWHTTGWALIGMSLPFFGWNFYRGRARLKLAPRRARWLWGAAAGLFFLLLYVPPIVHEIQDGGNVKQYFLNTVPSRRGIEAEKRPLTVRASDAAAGLSRDSAQRSFGWFASLPPDAPQYRYHAYAHGLIFLLVMIALIWRLRAEWGMRDDLPSVYFLLALTAGYWLLRLAQDRAYFDYFGEPWFGVPVLLAGWAAGTLLRRPQPGRGWSLRYPAAVAGAVAVALIFATGASQFPVSNKIKDGMVWHDHTFVRTQQIAADLLREVGDRPFSLLLIDGDGLAPAAHFHSLLWLGDNRPLNHYSVKKIRRPEFGEVLLIVARGKGAKIPVTPEGLIDWLAPPIASEDALIYKIHPENIPEAASGLRFDRRNGVILVRPLPAE